MTFLVGDIGNTLIKLSLLNKDFKIIKSTNIETKKIYKKENLKIFIKKIHVNGVNKKILFSSVVPNAFKKLKLELKKLKFKSYEVKEFPIKKIIKFNVKNIKQVGSDRIANAIGSYLNFKKDCLVVDFGTATTFDIIKKSGVYEGGVIAPGIKLSILNLNKSTALLPVLNLKMKTKAYGKNTSEALNAGFIWGYQGLINNIIKKISLASKTRYKIILTGGYANFYKKYIHRKSVIDENITIKGIIEIYKTLLI